MEANYGKIGEDKPLENRNFLSGVAEVSSSLVFCMVSIGK
jgi:hypothetical protein